MTPGGRRRGPALAAPLLAGVTVGAVVAMAVDRAPKPPPPGPPLGQHISLVALSRHRPVEVVDRKAAPPRRIQIPAIGVSARMVPLGLAPDRSMQVPVDTADAGWFEPGPEPGEQGPAVVAGHVDSKVGPAVFFKLGELRRGDLIRISRADGSVVRFRVQGLERWPKVSFPTRRVFGMTRGSSLRLITCSGAFDRPTGHYLDNTVVYAARVPARRSVGGSGPALAAGAQQLHTLEELDVVALPRLLPLERAVQGAPRLRDLRGIAVQGLPGQPHRLSGDRLPAINRSRGHAGLRSGGG
jgi:hypothetical protein